MIVGGVETAICLVVKHVAKNTVPLCTGILFYCIKGKVLMNNETSKGLVDCANIERRRRGIGRSMDPLRFRQYRLVPLKDPMNRNTELDV